MKFLKNFFLYVHFTILSLFLYFYWTESNKVFRDLNSYSINKTTRTQFFLPVYLTDLHHKLLSSEAKEFSQNGEDGVIQEILKQFLPINEGSYVEIGAGDGTESNTRYLREKFKWNGISFDFNENNLKFNVKMQKITHLNVLKMFEKFKIDKNFNLLSIDTDFADYWILEKILTKYQPNLVIHEVNQQPPSECVSVVKLNGFALWDNYSKYYGANICAYFCLAIRFDYSMIYCESQGVNCFWIRNDLLEQKLGKSSINIIKSVLNATYLYVKQNFQYKDFDGNSWAQIEKCY